MHIIHTIMITKKYQKYQRPKKKKYHKKPISFFYYGMDDNFFAISLTKRRSFFFFFFQTNHLNAAVFFFLCVFALMLFFCFPIVSLRDRCKKDFTWKVCQVNIIGVNEEEAWKRIILIRSIKESAHTPRCANAYRHQKSFRSPTPLIHERFTNDSFCLFLCHFSRRHGGFSYFFFAGVVVAIGEREREREKALPPTALRWGTRRKTTPQKRAAV